MITIWNTQKERSKELIKNCLQLSKSFTNKNERDNCVLCVCMNFCNRKDCFSLREDIFQFPGYHMLSIRETTLIGNCFRLSISHFTQ